MKEGTRKLILERYDEKHKLGGGGMGTVYKAHDTHLNRLVALKRLHLVGIPGIEERFKREAQNMAQLEHAHIASVYDVQYPFIVMQFIEGEDLQETLARRDNVLTVEQVIRLGTEMADALGCLEAHNIIHRDIKPANIIIKRDGAAVLADFGIALNAEQVRLTQHGVSGTLSYMSPEQAEGEKDIDHRSDIYSLGLVLYRCLAGALPVRTDEGDIPSVREFRTDVPTWLDAIILKCLEEDRKYRFQTADEVRQALQRREDAIQIEPSIDLPIIEDSKSRNALQSAEQLFSAGRFSDAKEKYIQALHHDPENIAIIEQIGACDRRLKTYIPGAPDPNEHPPTSPGGTPEPKAKERPGPDRSYGWRVPVGVLLGIVLIAALVWMAKDLGQSPTAEQIEEEVPLKEPEEKLPVQPQPVQLSGHINGVNTVAFSPDGALLASGSDDTTIRTWNNGQPNLVLSEHTGRVRAVAFSPAGTELASAGNDGKVVLWDWASGQVVGALSGSSQTVHTLAYSPDGAWLAAGGDYKILLVWDTETRQLSNEFTDLILGTRALAYSPDGMWLVAGDLGKIHLWSMETGQHEATLDGHSDRVNAVAFNSDGSLLASGSDDKTIRIWDMATREMVRGITESANWVRSVAFSPDGSHLATTDDQVIHIWEVATGALRRTIEGHSGPVNSVAFSPDGAWLASASDDETVRLWPLERTTSE